MKRIQQMIITRFAGIIVAVFLVADIFGRRPDGQEFQKANLEYEQAVPPGNEAAWLTYVNKLAQIID